jgi:ribonuclease Z
MNLLFLGAGEAFSWKANTSILVDETILADCGLTTLQQLFKAEVNLDKIKAVYISHLHADHCFSLSSLLVTCREESREEDLEIISPAGAREYIEKLLYMAYRKTFKDLGFRVEVLETEKEIQFGGYKLLFAPMEHSIPCTAVSIEKDGKKITYTGDGSPTPEVKKIAENTDLLIAEGYMEGVKGHCSILKAAEFARDSNAKKLSIVHVSRKENLEEKLEEARKIFPSIITPADLSVINL